MSNYKGHCAFNTLVALPLLVAAQFYIIHPKSIFLFIFAGAFVYTTFFMNPDLDLVHKIKLFSLRGLFSLPFRAYSTIFKHRGISHLPLLGSLTRLVWLLGIALLIFFLIYQTLPSKAGLAYYWSHYKCFFIYGFAGVVLADLCHLLLDLKLR
jgi:uncharacterized metal-binding protein